MGYSGEIAVMADDSAGRGSPEAPRDEDAAGRRRRLNERLRQAFIEGAEEDSRRRLGQGLTADELERVLRHYPGNLE